MMLCLSLATGAIAQTAKDKGISPIAPSTRELPAQEGLAEELAQAKPANVVELMDGPQTVLDKTYFWFLNPDGKTWDLLMLYNPGYLGPHVPFVLDTGTGQLIEKPDLVGFNFHLVSSDEVDGIHYFKTMTNNRGNGHKQGEAVWSYNPATNEFKLAGRPLGPTVSSSEANRWIKGKDGQFYGAGHLTDKSQVVAWRFDPRTMQSEMHPLAPWHKNLTWMYSHLVLDGDWLYVEAGNRPWHIWAFNFKTHEKKTLLTTGNFIGDVYTIRWASMVPESKREERQGYRIEVTEPAGSSVTEARKTYYWIKDGQITPVTDDSDTPPWSQEKHVAYRAPRSRTKSPAKPEVIRTAPDPHTGEVVLKWRYPDAGYDAPTGEVKYTVKRYNKTIRRLAPLNNNRLFALAESYGQAVVYDLNTNERIALGDSSLSTYSMTSRGHQVFMSGYPSTQIWVYDDRRPWTFREVMNLTNTKENAIEPFSQMDESSSGNPTFAARLGKQYHIHMPFAGTVIGADGGVYTAGAIIRIGNAGALAWWNPQTGEEGGLLAPFSAYRPYWLTGVPDDQSQNRYIVLTTKPTPDDNDASYTPDRARLFVFDVNTKSITHLVDTPDNMKALGPVTHGGPHVAVGMGRGNEGTRLYALDVRTGKMLWTRPVPFNAQTSFALVRRNAGTNLYTAPDNTIWSIWDDVVVNINPQDGQVKVVGRIPKGTTGDMVFMNDRIYLGGSTKLRQLIVK